MFPLAPLNAAYPKITDLLALCIEYVSSGPISPPSGAQYFVEEPQQPGQP